MNTATYNIMLDLQSPVARDALYMKQGDSMRKVAVSIAEGGNPYELTDDCSAILCAKLPDGSEDTVNMTASNNVLEATIPVEWAVTAGELCCEIQIIGSTDKMISTPRFSIIVSESFAARIYPVYWDICPNAQSVQFRTNRRKYVAAADFTVTIPYRGTESYAFLLIPSAIVPDSGLLFLTNGSLTFSDQGEQQKTTPDGTMKFHYYKSSTTVTADVPVTVKKVGG